MTNDLEIHIIELPKMKLEEGEGREQGKKEEKQQIAKKMKEKGSGYKFIQEVTGLTEEEIKEL